MASDPERSPETDKSDPPAAVVASASDSSERIWLPALLGILCAAAVVAALFGLTLLVIWWRE